MDDATGLAEALDPETAAAAKKAAATAATAALVGGLAGAAKALFDRRATADDDEPTAEEPEDEEPEDEDEPENDDDDDDDDDDGDDDADADDEPAATTENGAESSAVGKVVADARRHLASLLGEEPESVSGIRRDNGLWRVRLEVVDVHRIPESTDVLSSYEVVVDEDGGLVEVDRRRRYRRAQVEDDG
jgi:hypothetical protein